MTGFICLTVFAVMMVLYGRLRGPITENSAYNVAIAVIWMFDGAITTGVIEFGVVLKYVLFFMRGLCVRIRRCLHMILTPFVPHE